MLIAVITTLVISKSLSYELIGIGIIIGAIIGAFFAIRVEMTQMPQMVAIFNGFCGYYVLSISTNWEDFSIISILGIDLGTSIVWSLHMHYIYWLYY